MFTAILKVENYRAAKFAEFGTKADAHAHVDKFKEQFPDGFVYSGAYSVNMWIEGTKVTFVNTFENTLPYWIKMQKISITTQFEAAMQQITATVPANEISSWTKQEGEARRWIANNTVATPLIDALTQARGIEKTELVNRIILKADLFAGISGQLIGKRQALEDALDALPETATAEQVASINW